MVQSMFGTDGVRGRANSHPMTPEVALRLGQAAGRLLRRGPHRHRAVIGKDTRLSGYMIESALQAGFTSSGFDVFLLGPAPTPAVGMLTRSLRADVGVMVSASHNPSQDNGIKLFGPDGYKISDALEARLEDDMAGPPARSPADAIGRARRLDGAAERYVEFAKATFPKTLRLDGLKVVLDCANGAAYKIAPLVLWELGAEVIPIGVAPDGANINAGCGSTSPEACQRAVVLHGADLGIALDGDADRVLLIDETGAVADGDQILALIAARWSGEGRLTGGALVTTVMSNLGLERWLAGRGIGTLRTRVGDRHVVQRMHEAGCNIGGEQSGHIILTDFTTTGDGLIAGLQVLAALIETGRPASETLRLFEPVPQTLRNVRVAPGSDILAEPSVRAVIAAVETRLGSEGRLLVRPSGTEPMIRVMVEANDPVAVSEAVDDVCEAIAARG